MEHRSRLIGDLHHVSIAVADLDVSLRFYRDALGMRAVAEFEFDDEEHQIYMGLPKGARGRAVALRTGRPPAAGITIVQVEPARDALQPSTLEPGGAMLAFELPSADEVDALYARLSESGYGAISEPLWAEVKGFGRIRGVAMRDPDGSLIEFYAPEEAAA